MKLAIAALVVSSLALSGCFGHRGSCREERGPAAAAPPPAAAAPAPAAPAAPTPSTPPG